MNPRLGIIGGGQLALYLCLAAQKLDIEVAIMATPGDSPALKLADKAFCGDIETADTVQPFLNACDVVTFDMEAIPEPTLDLLDAAEAQDEIAVHPRTSILRMIKDKGLQKAWLTEQGLPTLPFCMMTEKPEAIDDLRERFGTALVQKARRGGYDGRGVQILQASAGQEDLWPVPSIIEPYLPDCREIAVLTVRARSGEQQTYPPVEMVFDDQINTLDCAAVPAAIAPALSDAATALARKTADALGGAGVFAMEMFITADDEILINEISPRVHNSGHLTMDACNVSQFEQHVRAVLGLPLEAIRTKGPTVMRNILYHDALEASCPDGPTTLASPESDATVYWYGKTTGQAGRKMGHINARGTTVEEAKRSAYRALQELADNSGGEAA